MTRAALARKSDAIIGAPDSFVLPHMMALGPSRLIFAPMRASSGTCIKRSGYMRSVIIEIPSACVIRAHICACRSVGNPGYGNVTASIGFIFAFEASIYIEFAERVS